MTYITEKYQLFLMIHHLDEEGLNYSTEVEMYSIPVDLMYVDGDDTIAVEFKTKDFQRGITQAKRNLSYVDFSYLSVWKSYLSENLVERVDDSSLGLIAIDDRSPRGGIEWVKPAERNKPNEYANKKVKRQITDEF